MLTAASISEFAVESSALEVWREWLAKYFDGASHSVGAAGSIEFPAVTLLFQQSAIPQPLSGAAITCTWIEPGVTEKSWDRVATASPTTQKVLSAYTSFLFWIRAELNTGAGQGKRLAQQVGERLYGLLNNAAATSELCEKGIHQIWPRPPQLVTEGNRGQTEYAMRLVSCQVMLRYPVLGQV